MLVIIHFLCNFLLHDKLSLSDVIEAKSLLWKWRTDFLYVCYQRLVDDKSGKSG